MLGKSAFLFLLAFALPLLGHAEGLNLEGCAQLNKQKTILQQIAYATAGVRADSSKSLEIFAKMTGSEAFLSLGDESKCAGGKSVTDEIDALSVPLIDLNEKLRPLQVKIYDEIIDACGVLMAQGCLSDRVPSPTESRRLMDSCIGEVK